MPSTAILVHGTFAPNAPWTKSDSSLAIAIRENGNVEFNTESFVWTGRNSFADRREASLLLAERIRAISEQPDCNGIHLIAHSHGGNVALQAAHRLAGREPPTKLASLTTLGTPFLRLRPKTWATASTLTVTFSLWFIILSIGILLFISELNIPFWIILALYAFVGFAIYHHMKAAELKAKETVRRHNGEEWRNTAIPILCLRYRLDEAGIWLTTLSIFSLAERLSYGIYSFFSGRRSIIKITRNIFFALLFSITLKTCMPDLLITIPAVDLIFWGSLIPALLLPLFSIIGTLVSCHKFGFAGRPVLHSLFLNIDLAKEPSGVKHELRVFSYTLGVIRAKKAGVAGLITPHSLAYIDPMAIMTIRNFVIQNATAIAKNDVPHLPQASSAASKIADVEQAYRDDAGEAQGKGLRDRSSNPWVR